MEFIDNSINFEESIFPVYDRENLSLLSEDHWNLYDIRTNEIINPLIRRFFMIKTPKYLTLNFF